MGVTENRKWADEIGRASDRKENQAKKEKKSGRKEKDMGFRRDSGKERKRAYVYRKLKRLVSLNGSILCTVSRPKVHYQIHELSKILSCELLVMGYTIHKQ